MSDEPTVAACEAQGYTHIRVTCATCGSITDYPFRLLHERHRRLRLDVLTIAQLGQRFYCQRCPGKPKPTNPMAVKPLEHDPTRSGPGEVHTSSRR